MSGRIAFIRPVPDSLAACELTHLPRVPVDVARARAQHAEYERALTRAGCDVRRVDHAPELPDSVFIEDTAVVLDEVAIIARPGAESRRGETGAVAAALAPWRPLRHLTAPATLDGGDILRLGRTLYTGLGSRTNVEGMRQLEAFTLPFGYRVRGLTLTGCLHLKTAVTELAPGLVLANPAWADTAAFDGHRTIVVDPGEALAANVLHIEGRIIAAAAYERTNQRLRAAGLTVDTIDVSELAKAEAGVTCCSLIVAGR